MDVKLLSKLTRAEGDLVSAMLTGDGELAAYDFAWTSLLDEISQASAFGDISTTTLAVADDVVARVSTLVGCCLSLSSVPPPSPHILNLNTSSPSPLHAATSFIPEAYSWLLDNIANPYPSSEFKASLAQRHNSPVSAVSSWFANARRRMGWTALCRDFFRNCRADAVDAAYRVLVKGDLNYQLGSEITHAFVTMKVTTEGLYATSEKSALAGDLDTVVKDMLDGDKILAGDRHDGTGRIVCLKEGEEHAQKQATCMLDISQKNSTTPICYPSPDLSHSASPVPGLDDSFTDESEDEEDISPPLLAGRKRRLSPPELAQVASSRETARPVKRPRFFSSSTNACLPSPSTSIEDSLENDSHDQTSHWVPGPQNSANIYSHKRWLSDPDATGMTKRPRAPMAGRRLHFVSDPLPLSTLESECSIDEWFNTNFDALFALPPPVDVAEPDHSTQWEVELFNNYNIPGDLQKVLTPPIQDNQISSTDLTVLEDFLQSLESGGFVASPEIIHPPTMTPVPDPVSQDLPLLPDLSHSIDWTALLNEEPFEPTSDPMYPHFYVNSALPDIDLPILQLPQVWATVSSRAT